MEASQHGQVEQGPQEAVLVTSFLGVCFPACLCDYVLERGMPHQDYLYCFQAVNNEFVQCPYLSKVSVDGLCKGSAISQSSLMGHGRCKDGH